MQQWRAILTVDDGEHPDPVQCRHPRDIPAGATPTIGVVNVDVDVDEAGDIITDEIIYSTIDILYIDDELGQGGTPEDTTHWRWAMAQRVAELLNTHGHPLPDGTWT